MKTYEKTELLNRGFAALQEQDHRTAEACCQKLLTADPKLAQAHFLVGLLATEQKNKKIAASAFNTVTKLDPLHGGAWAQLSVILSQLGYTLRAEDALAKAEANCPDSAVIQNLLGNVNTTLGEHAKARDWFVKAVAREPNEAAFAVNLANAQSFVGDTDDAARTLDAVLKKNPETPQAHWILSGLQKATDSKHADQMLALADKYADEPQAAAFLNYGAGKALEDLEDWERAFPAFLRGGTARRKVISFDEAEEERFFTALKSSCKPDWFERKSVVESAAPIFIIGQPRTGTTLVERIISSHAQVGSAGELQQFYLSIRRLSSVQMPGRMGVPLAHAAAELEPTKLGRAYVAATMKHAQADDHFVDKMPTNYLFAPHIARALPHAKIIHLTRNPMDSCFSSFKQLFADAYPHSYSLEEMARHHVRYLDLMDHWRNVLGDRLLDISYEETVAGLETNARRLIAFLGLEWDPACLEFHRQSGSVSTASAVQVRSPVHSRSVGRWRRYEAELQPVSDILSEAGVL